MARFDRSRQRSNTSAVGGEADVSDGLALARHDRDRSALKVGPPAAAAAPAGSADRSGGQRMYCPLNREPHGKLLLPQRRPKKTCWGVLVARLRPAFGRPARARTRLVLVHEFKLLAGNSEPRVPLHVAGRHPVAGRRLVIPAVSLLAETLLPHMREQADALQSSHANMSKNVTITPMTVQSMSCPSTLSISPP